jgi:uncharacterized protein
MYLGYARISQDLPIFRRENGETVLYYAPGYLVQASRDEQHAIERDLASRSSVIPEVFALKHSAHNASLKWANQHDSLYEPVCLTVYLENRCNLHCPYCYSSPVSLSDQPATRDRLILNPETIRKAAGLVAANCREREIPFTLVVHGGGEPTLETAALHTLLSIAHEVAEREEIGLFKYIATNGVLSVAKARWLANKFDLIGVSCDGPEDIQKRQRPLPGGKSSSFYVERTTAVFREAGTPFNIRVTITPETVQRQEEIADYLCTVLRPQEIHIEPVYLSGRAATGAFAASCELAETFVKHFTRAQIRAKQDGIPVLFAGARPWDIHGPYCHIFRSVLNLVPGDVATPCFKLSDITQVNQPEACIGQLEADSFSIDYQKISHLGSHLAKIPPRCAGCFNQYHCARGCPDECFLSESDASTRSDPTAPPEYRCRVQMLLANAVIERAASAIQPSQGKRLGGTYIQVNG